MEECAIESPFKEQLVEYIQVCCTLAEKLSQVSGKVSKLSLNGYKLAEEEVVKRYSDVPDEKHKLMNVLKELVGLKVDANSNLIEDKKDSVLENSVKEIIEKKENNLSMDMINTVYTNERYIRPFIDLVLENSLDKSNIKVF
jgi:hypothetical protein